MLIGSEVEEQPPLFKVTEYVPAVLTLIDLVVSCVDQTLLVTADDVRVTEPPSHIVVPGLAVIIGLTI